MSFAMTTVSLVRRQAVEADWSIPLEFPLQEHYVQSGEARLRKSLEGIVER